MALYKKLGVTLLAGGISVELWRARVGGYFPGIHKVKPDMAAIRLYKARLGVHLLCALDFPLVLCCSAMYKQYRALVQSAPQHN